MDPLSVAASIAGLLVLSGTIISKGYASAAGARKNKDDVEIMLKEVIAFSGILVGLKTRYSNMEDSESMPLPWLIRNYKRTWQESIRDCEKTLEEVDEVLESLLTSNIVRLMVKSSSTTQRVAALVARIERYKGFFVLCLQLENNNDTEETGRLTNGMFNLLQDVLHGQESLKQQNETKEERSRRQQIIQWLGQNSETVQADVVRNRAPQSSAWLLNRKEYLSWLSSEGSATFWLNGIQGSGKTVIVSKVIETIQNEYVQQDDALVYHYCRFSDTKSLSSERVLGSMIAMILSNMRDDSPIPEALSKASRWYQSSTVYPNMQELRQVFHDVCQSCFRIFIVIDGLDEVTDKNDILDFLNELPTKNTIFKVFVASRPELDLARALESCLRMTITPSDVQLDIERFVQQKFKRLQIVDQQDETCSRTISSELAARAQGMFLWAVFQIDHLSRIRTAITMDVLTDLPRELENTFEDALLRLEKQDQMLALQILRVILFSHCPLSLSELVEAIAVKSSVSNLKQLRKAVLRRPSDVFELCGSFILHSQSTNKISLAHHSIKEFLSRPILHNGRRNQFYLEEVQSLRKQLESCLLYLLFDDFDSKPFQESLRHASGQSCSDTSLQAFAKAPFLRYAATYWTSHLRELKFEHMPCVWPLLEKFLLGRNRNFKSWTLISRHIHGHYKFPRKTKPIHVAALCGHKSMMMKILEVNSACIDLKTSDGRTPLHIALENEHDEVTAMLLHQGASLKSTDESHRTPLHMAIESGNELSVTLLVSAGADINAVGLDGRTPISVAVENRWDGIANFLLPIPNAGMRLPDGRTLLHLAAQSGSSVWTVALLHHHSETLIDARDDIGWTPLMYAADYGYTKIVQILISCGCLLDAQSKKGFTPLHAAIRQRDFEIASLILKANWPGGRVETLAATSRRLPDTVTSKQGQSVSDDQRPNYASSQREKEDFSPNVEIGTPLEIATERQKREMPTPLRLAISTSYVDGIGLLVTHKEKLKISVFDIRYGLDFAISLRNADVILKLLKLLHMELSYQAITGFEEIIISLISLRIERVEEWLRSTFAVSVVYESLIPLKMAKARKADVAPILDIWPNANERDIKIALGNCTTEKQCHELATIFVHHNLLIPNVIFNSKATSLLHVAIELYDIELAKAIVEQGQDLNAENESGETALLFLARLKPLDSNQDRHSQQQFLDLAHHLVLHGGDPKTIDKKGRGMCHKAAIANNANLLDWCVNTLNLRVDLPDEQFKTPLNSAIDNGCILTTQRLLERCVASSDDIGRPRMECIIDNMNYGNRHNSPLFQAINNGGSGMLPILGVLIEADDNAFERSSPDRQKDLADLRTSFYVEALCQTIKRNFFPGFTFLLSKISSPTLFRWMTPTGENILHIAVQAVDSDYLKLLLEKLANDEDAKSIIQIANAEGRSPLSMAIATGILGKVSLLLHSGAKVMHEQVELVGATGNAELEDLVLQHRNHTIP